LKVAIHQPHYFPYPGFFHKVSLADAFVIMDDVQYDRGFINRNRILDVHGPVWLTVPINKSQKFMTNMQVEVNNSIPWTKDHLKKIQVSYSNAKYFHLYRDYLEAVYDREWPTVFELDLATLKKTFEWLGISVPIIRESELNIASKGTQRLVDVCAAVGADTYVSGRGGRDYMDEPLFQRNDLKLEYQAYSPSPYPQRMSGSFVPDLSILDMLANLGPSSMGFITECTGAIPVPSRDA
jgi:WbqC-like protein